MRRYLAVFLALVAVIAAPMILRPAASVRTEDYAVKDRLVVITPHVETLRYELERAFTRWMQEKYQRRVVIDWRVPGGTSDILKVVNSEFTAAKAISPDRGIGIDVMTGGGPIDYGGLLKSGYIVPRDASGKYGPGAVKDLHPDWFTDKGIPAKLSGQDLYEKDLHWVGTCLSAFGICWNIENMERRGLKAPTTWVDLASPVFENQLAISDPTKSGTVTAMFECILQMSMAEGAAKMMAQSSDSTATPEAKKALKIGGAALGWPQGLNVIRQIGANTRYWTDSSTKIPLDVSQGEALAGMCVDFYGRNVMERLTKANGKSRLGYISPAGGTTVSPQPVAMFRGAANPELATRFIEFVISPEGQKIWGFKAGASGGPEKMALRNMPIRRDYYADPENIAHAADPSLRPLDPGMAFPYEPEFTGALFGSIRFIIRAMCIDTHLELKEAWHELIAHGFPTEATAVFNTLPPELNYEAVKKNIAPVLSGKDAVAKARLARELSETFRLQYLKAKELARSGQ